MPRTLRDWQSDDVDLHVELATSGDITVSGVRTELPFVSGGSNAVPVGWTQYGSTYPTNAKQTVSSDGLWSMYYDPAPTSQPSINGWGAEYFIPAITGRRYRFEISVRGRDGSVLTGAYVECDWWNATPQTQRWDQETSTGGDTWNRRVLISPAAPAFATHTRIRVYLQPLIQSGMTAWNFGLEWSVASWLLVDATQAPFVWHDVTCDVKSLAWRYGRERFTSRYDVATLAVELRNDAGTYTYRKPHPLNLGPGRPMRVYAVHNAVTYPLAWGVIDNLADGLGIDGRVVTVINCVDPSTLLSNVPTSGMTVTTNAKHGARVERILDYGGYVPRAVDVGQFTTRSVSTSGQSLRDTLGVTADSEGGAIFADRVGQIVFKDRAWPTNDPNLYQCTAWLLAADEVGKVDPTPDRPGAPTVCLREAITNWSQDRIVNDVSLANAGGTAQRFTNQESIRRYGSKTYERMDFVNKDSSTLATRANDIMTGYAFDVLRLTSVAYRPSINPNAWIWTLSVFLNWLVRVSYSNPTNRWGWETVTHVQAVEHRVTVDDWEVRLALDLPTAFHDVEWAFTNGWDVAKWDDANFVWDEKG